MKAKLTVIKIGGEIINNSEKLDSFLSDFSRLDEPKILIHGGGKIATALSAKLGIETRMHEGRRITSKENLDVVTMVYAGLINKNITASLQSRECNAIGLSGADANTILASKRPLKPTDYGFVGDIQSINSKVIDTFIENQMVPIFSAICHDGKGLLLNTNADTIATEIAIAMSAKYDTELIYCFDKKGVLMDVNDEDSVVENINTEGYRNLREQNVIHDGMLPKMENAFHALNNNVSKVMIGNTNFIKNRTEAHTLLTL
ncbi:MAG: acetylglutamate kinase [Flavobacteriales bacterium]|nr:acetylglutamate kinase [Flavobacteriales bacterium]